MFVRYNVSLHSFEIVTIGPRGLYRHYALANSLEHAKRLMRRGGDSIKSF